MLKERGVDLTDIARLVLLLQQPYNPTLGLAACLDSVSSVLAKREVQHALLTGIVLDVYAEKGMLPPPLQDIIAGDEPKRLFCCNKKWTSLAGVSAVAVNTVSRARRASRYP